ncbi:hypothetical protein IAQ61_006467 [Plenodomus lingam]|uniref:uncharacterized protein n=1 Tax=Leptosphaeria maculans TaxID=5022 RepID=UPI0033197122|nr:hypothetical protein IAQ61_006467 [Plenodomus lingam]
MVTSRERTNDKTPVGLKTDSVISACSSSSRGGDTRTTTASSVTTYESNRPSPGQNSTAPCHTSDWRIVKQSLRGLWKSAHGTAFKRS